MSPALTRRGALCGAAAAAIGLAAGVAPAFAAAVPISPATASPDAALIDLAGRYARLVVRDEAMWVRRSTQEDRAQVTAGEAPPRPKVPNAVRVLRETTAMDDVLVITTNRGADTAAAAVLTPWRAAVADVEAAQRAMEARLGVPRISKLIDRSRSRIWRWGARLTDAEPQTAAGLAAKAAAVLALGERFDGVLDETESRLAMSLVRDVARLNAAGRIAHA